MRPLPRFLKYTVTTVCVVFLALQFIRPEKNLSDAPNPLDLLARHEAPAPIRTLLQTACYDCHSDHTRYPWYAELQPAAWFLDQHVREGKAELNFSTFGSLTPKRARAKIESAIDALDAQEMPLASYTWIHRDARLTPAQRTALTTWLQSVADSLE